MVTPELEAAVDELARRLRDDLAAGLGKNLRERAIEQYLYEVVNLHLERMLAGPLPPQDEIERRFEAALAHAAEAAGLPREAIEPYRRRAREHWGIAATRAQVQGMLAAFHDNVTRTLRPLQLLVRPLWGLSALCGAPARGAGERPQQDASAPAAEGPVTVAEKPPSAAESARGRKAQKPEPEFANRARWFTEKLREKHLSVRRLFEERGGPAPATARRILRGQAVSQAALEKLARALRVPPEEIPPD
jgi:hypothetical protein